VRTTQVAAAIVESLRSKPRIDQVIMKNKLSKKRATENAIIHDNVEKNRENEAHIKRSRYLSKADRHNNIRRIDQGENYLIFFKKKRLRNIEGDISDGTYGV
jgi:hypothetical protein